MMLWLNPDSSICGKGAGGPSSLLIYWILLENPFYSNSSSSLTQSSDEDNFISGDLSANFFKLLLSIFLLIFHLLLAQSEFLLFFILSYKLFIRIF